MNNTGNIGIFDSGIGGITVMKEIMKILPKENYIYYSDSKNNPYGDKTDVEVRILCDNIVQKLLKQNCKVIVIACNTASAKSANFLRDKYKDIPFLAIEPAYKMVHDYAFNELTLVMATKGTIESEKFNILFKKYDNNKTYLMPCIGLANIIENGDEQKINNYLKDNLANYKNKIKNIVLGCTHYPLIEKNITNYLGKVRFFNGAPNLARHLKKILEEKKLINNNGTGLVKFEDSQGLLEKEKRFFNLLHE